MDAVATGQRTRLTRETVIITALLALIFLFDIFTIRQGHGWGDDFAMYIHHAENIALHHPYADTGYIYNQREAWYGPRSYPPVFPLLLAPVIKLYGLNLTAMKVEEVIAFVLSLLLIYLLFRRELELPYLVAMLAIVGFNPTLWEIKDSVTSDYPFWAFFLLAAYFIEQAPRDGKAAWIWGVATGVVLYLAYGTRSVGLLLLPGFVVYEAVKIRRVSRFAPVALAVAAVLIIAQRQFLNATEASYADQFHTAVPIVLQNVRDYASVLAFLWPWTAGRVVSYLLFALITSLAAAGAWISIRRRGLRPLEPLLAFYLAVVLIWPGNQGIRFLLPMLPLYFAFAFIALSTLTVRYSPSLRWGALGFLLLWIGFLYAGDFRKREFTRIPETSGSASFKQLCDFIREHTSPRDVFVFYRARALSLFTDRPASVYFLDGTPAQYEEQWRYMRQIGTDYVIYSTLFEPDREFLKPVLDRHAAALEPVYRNTDFVVYRLQPLTVAGQ